MCSDSSISRLSLNRIMASSVTSTRAQKTLENMSFKDAWTLKADANTYHEETNPKGIINIGVAENKLSTQVLLERLNKDDVKSIEASDLYYPAYHGSLRFREAVAALLNRKFKTKQTLKAENMLVTSGVGASLDLLAHAIGDPGDCILIPAPYYYSIKTDIGDRGQIRCIPVYTDDVDAQGQVSFSLTMEKIQTAYREAKEQGHQVKGILLINPNNPTGAIYTPSLIAEVLQFAAKEELHVICDEIYSLSVYEGAFHSSVSQQESLPDPSRTHMLWGFSKDLTLSGYRVGVIHSWNPQLLDQIRPLCYFSACPAIVQRQMGTLLMDTDWLDNVFFPSNHAALVTGRDLVTSWLDKLGIPHLTPKAAFFVWADFSKHLSARSQEAEVELFQRLFEGGVFVLPCVSAYYGRSPGFFRIVFPLPQHLIDRAFERIQKILGM